MNKPRIVKDFDKLSDSIIEQIKLAYPYGFERKLVTFKNASGQFVSALPFESDEFYYLVRMTKQEAREIIKDDDDFDKEGNLKQEIKDDLSEKYEDEELDEEIEDKDYLN